MSKRPLLPFVRPRHLGVAGAILCLFGSLGCLGSAQLSTGLVYDEPVVYVEPAPVVYRAPPRAVYRAAPYDVRVYRTQGPTWVSGNGRGGYRPRNPYEARDNRSHQHDRRDGRDGRWRQY